MNFKELMPEGIDLMKPSSVSGFCEYVSVRLLWIRQCQASVNTSVSGFCEYVSVRLLWIRQWDSWLHEGLRTPYCKCEMQIVASSDALGLFKWCVFKKLNISEHFLCNILDLLFVLILPYIQWKHVFVQYFPIPEGELFFCKVPSFRRLSF